MRIRGEDAGSQLKPLVTITSTYLGRNHLEARIFGQHIFTSLHTISYSRYWWTIYNRNLTLDFETISHILTGLTTSRYVIRGNCCSNPTIRTNIHCNHWNTRIGSTLDGRSNTSGINSVQQDQVNLLLNEIVDLVTLLANIVIGVLHDYFGTNLCGFCFRTMLNRYEEWITDGLYTQTNCLNLLCSSRRGIPAGRTSTRGKQQNAQQCDNT